MLQKALLIFIFIFSLAADTFAETQNSLLIVSIDGLRPDVLLRSDAPNIKNLIQRSSYTFYALTTDLAITLPSHTSMLTGVSPDKHEITWNDDRLSTKSDLPKAKTVFQLAKENKISSALIAGKPKFKILAQEGRQDWSWIAEANNCSDNEVLSHAIETIRSHNPQLLFVHLPGVDSVGHELGWGSIEQTQAIHLADSVFGKLSDEFSKARGTSNVYIILASDHGGKKKGHGRDDPLSAHIPLIIKGPDVTQNKDQTLNGNSVRIEDIFSTACKILNVPIPAGVDGRVLVEFFNS